MNNPIKVSVVVPVYNNEKYINECLDSLINQNLHDIEIICVNDGSTDNTLHVLNTYANNDSRIQIINQKNSGPGSARNVGIRKAKGKYLYFVDSDDKIEADCLETLYYLSEKNNSEMCLVGVNAFDDTNDSYFPYMNFSTKLFKNGEMILKEKKNFYNLLFFRTAPFFYFYKREFFIKNNLFFNEDYLLGEDVLTALRAKLKVNNFAVCGFDLYHYRINQKDSITSNMNNKKIDNLFSYLKDIYMLLQEEKKWQIYKKYYYDYCSFNFFSYFLVSEKNHFLDKLTQFNKELSLLDSDVIFFSDRKNIEYYFTDNKESYDLRCLAFYTKNIIKNAFMKISCSLSGSYIKISICNKNLFTFYSGVKRKVIYLFGRRFYKKTLF